MDRNEKQKLIEECRSSGMTAKAWCEEKGIGYRKYVGWASQINKSEKASEKQRWVALELRKGTESEHRLNEIRLECGRWKISIGSGFDPGLLADVLRAVSAVC